MESLDLLKINKIKNTKARREILQMLLGEDKYFNVEEIYNQCLSKQLNINLSTVYRTLELLTDKSIVDKINLGDGKYSYSLNQNSHKHILECSLCHKEIEVDCPMKQVEEMIRSKTGFTMMEHQLLIKGVCDKCKK